MVLLSLCTVLTHAQNGQRSAKAIEYTKAAYERDSVRSVYLSEQFLKDYPPIAANYNKDLSEGIQYSRIYTTLISRTRAPILEKIREYYDIVPFFTVAELYYRQVLLMNQNKVKTADELVEPSRLLLKKLSSFKNKKPLEFTNNTDEEWQQSFNNTYFLDLQAHINILRKTNNTKEGIAAAEEYIKHVGYNHSAVNEDFALLLRQADLKDKLQEVLIASVNANQATPVILGMLKADYITKNKSEKDFDAYIESLKNKDSKDELELELKNSMIKKEIPDFAMYDSDGKWVSTKDWKGKIVVLDFFASWCIPCKAAFPGMKMAQEKFAGDKDVLFYFIDNQETTKTYKSAVMKYMKDNNFPFHVLFDNEGPEGKNDQVAKLLGVSAIPRKMIIDKNGLVRFDKSGYFGSPTKLADEIKLMVNLIKKQSN